MDSADSVPVRVALQNQGSRIHQQEEQLSILRQEMKEMAERQERIMTSLGEEICCLAGNIQKMQFQSGPPPGSSPPPVSPPPAAMPLPPSAPFPHLSKPEKFSGVSGDCQAFLVQCGLHFELQAAAYPTEQSKVAFIISHLSGRAEAWATAEWSRHSPICDSLKLFLGLSPRFFNTPLLVERLPEPSPV